MLLRYTRLLAPLGAPVDRLLARARIPDELLSHPAAAVPLETAFRFGESACRTLGTEHLGLHVGLATSLEGLGPYGEMLRNALTVHDYLRKGISLYNRLMTGQHLWLSEHGQELRLNLGTVGPSELGAYQSHIETLTVTIANLRRAAGPDWAPREISLVYRTREDFPDCDLFAGSRIFRGTGETYVTIPRSMMGLRFPAGGDRPAGDGESPLGRPLPEGLPGLVQLQIESLLSDRAFQIDCVAESLAMSARTLQRRLDSEGLTYSQLLADTRMHRAADWLESTDKTIGEIAFDLGYTDASNFTRAFRVRVGAPPQAFRDRARRT